MSDHKMTTAIRLKDGSVPVNAHTMTEDIVVVDSTKGLSLQAILDDLESRVYALENP